MENKRYLVFDVGGTAIKYALMNGEGDILEKGEFPTPQDCQESFISALCDQYEAYRDHDIEGIAFSIPGGVDTENGYVSNPGALVYNRECHLARRIQDALEVRFGKRIPVCLENDGKAAALAEVWKGNLQGIENGAVVVLGTGIGGGLIINGKLHKGQNFFAGEMSFLLTDMKTPGLANALAMRAGTGALVSRVAQAKAVAPAEMNGFKVMELVESGDAETVAIFEDVCDYIAGLIYNLICLLNVDRVLIGGGISRQPRVVETIRRQLQAKVDLIRAEGMPIPSCEVACCKFFNDANLLGALYNYQLHDS